MHRWFISPVRKYIQNLAEVCFLDNNAPDD